MTSTALTPIDAAGPRRAALPTPIDKDALRLYLKAIDDPAALELQRQLAAAYDKACAALIGENDVQVEQGRTFKKKSAWRKLGRYFGITTEVVAREHQIIEDDFVAMVTVRATAPWGQIAEAVGACGTDEEKGRRKITMADAIATAETRATNRAVSNLIAMGEVSAEEIAKNEVADRSARAITLAEAREYPFPWRKPEKYADKPMGNLSYNMLVTVRDAIAKEIEKSGETAKRLEIKRVCELLIEDAEESSADGTGETEDEQRPDPTTPSAPSSATTSNTSKSATGTSAAIAGSPVKRAPADGSSFADDYAGAPLRAESPSAPAPTPAKGAPDSVYALTQRFNKLAEYLPADMREDTLKELRRIAKKGGAEHLKYLQASITSMEELLAGALDEKDLTALGIDRNPLNL